MQGIGNLLMTPNSNSPGAVFLVWHRTMLCKYILD